MTLCTIAIPVYNRAGLVCQALESALAQPDADLEILVVDNCSTDGTWEALQKYHDPRLRLIRNDVNIGLFNNLNRCLELAQGTYLRILCSDDRLVPGCIAAELALMEANPGVGLLSTRARQIDADNRERGLLADDLPPGLYAGQEMIGHLLWVLAHYTQNPINYPSGILLRRETALAAGRFTDEFRLVGDVDYWMRIFMNSDVILADHIGCEVRIHAGQEGNAALASGVVIDEFYTLADRYGEYLRRYGVESRVRKQLAGCALWFVYQFRKQRRSDVARRYWQTAVSQRYSPLTLAAALGRFFVLMRLQRHFKIRLHPRLSPRPLVACAAPRPFAESGATGEARLRG